jgi:hypothetical protein
MEWPAKQEQLKKLQFKPAMEIVNANGIPDSVLEFRLERPDFADLTPPEAQLMETLMGNLEKKLAGKFLDIYHPENDNKVVAVRFHDQETIGPEIKGLISEAVRDEIAKINS